MDDTNNRSTETDFDGEPTRVDFDTKPTGVKVEADHDEIHEPVPQEQRDNGLGQQVPTTPEATGEPPPLRQSNRLTKKWKHSYVPSYKGSKYDLALTQVTKSLQGANNATSLAQMFIKLMSKGVHSKADTVGLVMAQVKPNGV